MSTAFSFNPAQLTRCVDLDEIPAEIFIKFFRKQEEKADLFKCRLVSRKWNEFATYVLRKVHRGLKFESDEKLSEFNKIIPTNGSHHLLPFSKFEFDLTKLRIKSVQEFAKTYGGDAEAYTFQSRFGRVIVCPRRDLPRDVVVTPAELEERGQILLHLLIHSRQLKSLIFNMEFPFLLPLDATRCLKVFPNLKFLEFKFRCDPYKNNEESLLEKLVQLSPGLQVLYLSSEYFYCCRNYYLACRAVKDLPKFLKRIPSHIKLGIALEWKKSDENILQELLEFPRTIIYIHTHLFQDVQINSLVWRWVRSQANSLVRLTLFDFSDLENPVVTCPVFPKCVELSINFNDMRNNGIHLKFPNVTKLTLNTVNYSILLHFVSKLPLLEELRIRTTHVSYLGWGFVTGEDGRPTEEEMEDCAKTNEDLRIDKPNPFQNMSRLKILRVRFWSTGFLWGLVYHSLRKQMPPLDLLELAIDGGESIIYGKLPTNEDLVKYKEFLATANHKIIRFSKSKDVDDI